MNYIGSKYSLLDFLERTIADVTGYHNGDNYIFADLFSGTGIVGQTYKAPASPAPPPGACTRWLRRYQGISRLDHVPGVQHLFSDDIHIGHAAQGAGFIYRREWINLSNTQRCQ